MKSVIKKGISPEKVSVARYEIPPVVTPKQWEEFANKAAEFHKKQITEGLRLDFYRMSKI